MSPLKTRPHTHAASGSVLENSLSDKRQRSPRPMKLNKVIHRYLSTAKTTSSKTGFKTYTHVLLSVRQNFPQSGEKLDPRLLCQSRGDVAQLDKGAEQGSRLQKEQRIVEPRGSPRVHTQDTPVPCFGGRSSPSALGETEQVSGQSKNTDSEHARSA